eukprot:TRINITY_DN7455_c0_g1_i1.p1 TRINITY_DN7455_c0_g1~~TRINITY_DN7455_c0_g1_i1.p1  ORF type:complete len:510 (+),score=125.90 TRINITY_DN7455_c0_g1_i1:266-1795(+)
MLRLFQKRRFSKKLKRYSSSRKYDYDVVVIGGGSGGISASKKASELGLKVGLLDFVKPSSQNTTWGLGGTCVNVGCIPKKLFHQASIVGETIKESHNYGWNIDSSNSDISNDWSTLAGNIQQHIKSLNFGYRSQLKKNFDVDYMNKLAKFIDNNTLEVKNRKGVTETITSDKFIIAVGGRPKVPTDVPGAIEYAYTSDDIFSFKKPPGKTLVVGASYVALECAGFLTGLGYDTTVMVRSILLRGFDQQIAKFIGTNMEESGTKFIRGSTPSKISLTSDNQYLVEYNTPEGDFKSEVYDTVLYATGRYPDVDKLNIEKLGINIDQNQKIITNDLDQTNVPNIFAIGDCVSGKPELTPVAIKAGKLLAKRLAENDNNITMNYDMIPTTVFTPLEYGTIGLTEDEAQKRYGDDMEVYHSFFLPLEYALPHRKENECYAKLICNKSDDNRVVGLHILGPNAGEITQGYAVAMKLGARYEDFEETIGIHPTVSEEIVSLTITKRSGLSPEKTGC